MSNKWKKIKSWNVGTPEGNIEKYSLYEDEETGDFRIQNDFGNITIDMERMSAREFIRKASEGIDDAINDGIYDDDDDWIGTIDLSNSQDCSSNSINPLANPGEQ